MNHNRIKQRTFAATFALPICFFGMKKGIQCNSGTVSAAVKDEKSLQRTTVNLFDLWEGEEH